MTLDDADKTWNVLADQLETFISNWETGDKVPELARFLPAAPHGVDRADQD